MLRGSPAGRTVYGATGSSLSIAAGRLSFALGLHGPCLSVEAACASSLVAAHIGAKAVRGGECPEHLVVGVNLMLLPAACMGCAVAGMTSALGRCHTFVVCVNLPLHVGMRPVLLGLGMRHFHLGKWHAPTCLCNLACAQAF